MEFTVDHVSLASLALDDHEIFSMYEDGYGIGEPLTYGSYRENHYKIMIRAYAAARRTGRRKSRLLMSVKRRGVLQAIIDR